MEGGGDGDKKSKGKGKGRASRQTTPSASSSQGDMADNEAEAGSSQPGEQEQPPPPPKKRARRSRQPPRCARFFALANLAVSFARRLRAWRRQSMSTTMKMKAQPRAMSRICHHSSLSFEVITVGLSMPVTVGVEPEPVPVGVVLTSSLRQTPRPEMTLALLSQLAATHEPSRRTCEELEHARHSSEPGPEQDEQLESHDWQLEVVAS